MGFAITRRLAPFAVGAAMLAGLAAPGVASADIHWLVSGVFDDTGTLSGYFDINVYGFLDGFDLTTTAGTTESGFEYTPETSYFSNGTFYVDAEPGYFNDLHLEFLDPITTAVASNPIVGGENGPSYECAASWSCYVNSGGTTRFLASGSATAGGVLGVPEPGAWMLLLTGFGGAGAMLRDARQKARLATA
jgi:hypothetical protein